MRSDDKLKRKRKLSNRSYGRVGMGWIVTDSNVSVTPWKPKGKPNIPTTTDRVTFLPFVVRLTNWFFESTVKLIYSHATLLHR